MKIDIRDVKCCWINLDSATENAEKMEKQFDELGIENHERLSARQIEPPPGTPQTIYHYVGCAQSHIDILENEMNGDPLLILEDDAKYIPDWYNSIIENIPDNTDAIYLGTSHGDGRYFAQDIGYNLARIKGVYATHAILYLTEKYKKAVVDIAKEFVYNRRTPFDLGCATIQHEYNVLSTHLPLFYQADERDSANKWENLTKVPLRMLEEKAGALGPGYGSGPKGV
tara:strand:+ start:247 stop:927 length:681 start_codon:yes stop_codon:yes gene_type:complete